VGAGIEVWSEDGVRTASAEEGAGKASAEEGAGKASAKEGAGKASAEDTAAEEVDRVGWAERLGGATETPSSSRTLKTL
jgi:hypothetical protein